MGHIIHEVLASGTSAEPVVQSTGNDFRLVSVDSGELWDEVLVMICLEGLDFVFGVL